MLVTAVVLLMMVSTNAQLTISVSRDGVSLDNNRITLECRDSKEHQITAYFYGRVPHDGRELLINPKEAYNVKFVITIDTEGSYFCNSSMGQSNLQEINGK